MSDLAPPSSWFARHVGVLKECAVLGPAADLACGRGRHSLAAARAGLPVVGVDRNRELLAELSARAREDGLRVDCVIADLEAAAIPLAPARLGAVLVFRYLHRPLAGAIAELIAPGGLLLYETFTVAQRGRGFGPSRDAFLLRPGELPSLFPGLEVLDSWEGESDDPKPAAVARLLARRPQAPS